MVAAGCLRRQDRVAGSRGDDPCRTCHTPGAVTDPERVVAIEEGLASSEDEAVIGTLLRSPHD